MKTKLVLAFSVVLFALASTSQAGWGRGCGWGGGGWGGPRFGWSAGWSGGGYCGPRWGWGGGWGPGWGVAVAAPVAVYRPVYYSQPVYAQPVYYTTRRVVVTPAAQSQLVQAQAQLSRLGYYRGQVDGSFGPLTCKAIAQYQADNGLKVTGRLDRATLKSLGA